MTIVLNYKLYIYTVYLYKLLLLLSTCMQLHVVYMCGLPVALYSCNSKSVCVCAVVHVVRVNIEIWWISVCSIPHLGYYVFAYLIIYHLMRVNWCTCVSVFLSLS